MRGDQVEYDGQKYEYILSIIDVFSRYLICRPLQNKSSLSVSRALKKIFLEFGTPKVIQCDNGTEFKGHFDSLMKKIGVKK